MPVPLPFWSAEGDVPLPGGLPPTWTMSKSPSMTGVLPTPKKFCTTPNSFCVSTFQTTLPSATWRQCSIPSTP